MKDIEHDNKKIYFVAECDKAKVFFTQNSDRDEGLRKLT